MHYIIHILLLLEPDNYEYITDKNTAMTSREGYAR